MRRLLAVLAAIGWALGAVSASATPFAPNIMLPGGNPGYLLHNTATPGADLLLGLIPGNPIVPQALSFLDQAHTQPSDFNGTDSTSFTIFFGLMTNGGMIAIPGDPCSPLGTTDGLDLTIGSFSVQLFAMPQAQGMMVGACSSSSFHQLSMGELGGFSHFTAFELPISFTADPPATLDVFVLDAENIPQAFADPVPEPGTLALLAGALAMLGAMRRWPRR